MQPIIATGKSSLYSTEFQKVLKNMPNNEKLSKEQLQYGVADTFPNFIQYNNLCVTTYTSNKKILSSNFKQFTQINFLKTTFF